MSEGLLQEEARRLVEGKSFAELKAKISAMEEHDLAELLVDLADEELAVVFRLLPQALAAEIFGELEIEQQEELLTTLSSEKVAAILNDMPPDDRTELLEELPGQLGRRLLSGMRGEELKIARSLLAYPEDSVGRLMTPQYVAVRADWTIEQVFAHIRQVGAAKETLNVIYVIDSAGKLVDELALEQLVMAEPTAMAARDLMDEQVAALHASDDQEQAVEMFKKYDAVALPVVTAHSELVGIVTVDDVLDVAEEENTEDFQKMVGVEALESSYFHTPHLQMIRKRLPWLALLFMAEVLTVLAIISFEGNIDQGMLLLILVFTPLINACSGNTGSQMAGLMIRGLALGEMDVGDWKRILGLELVRGLTFGVVLAALAFPTALAFGRPYSVATAVAVAMAIAVTFANLIGSMLPFVFKRLGVDPAVTSAPFIASLMDISSVLIYFSIAVGIFALLGG